MRLRPLLFVAVLVRAADAQAPDTTAGSPRTTVSGVVHDSLAHVPLVGAAVQLVGTDPLSPLSRTAISDSLGRYTITGVPAGRYLLGFLHDMLDSLGLEPPLREVSIDGRQPVRVDLAIPSAARLRTAICGTGSAADSGTLVVGLVRDARSHTAVSGAMVTAMWLEFVLTAGRLDRRTPQRFATTAGNGWFALCHLPGDGMLALLASRGADSTDLIEVVLPTDRFMRRDLYLGPGGTVASGGSATPRRTGDGRLTGVVISAVGGRPLEGAQVNIRDGPVARANERGEWTIVGAPLGTRMLEVRAVGYYPQQRPVDVVTGAPSVRSALSTMKAVLDTVMVTASRLDRDLRAFEERRRMGQGRYLTPEDIARRQPVATSDLFRMVPGMRVERTELGDSQVLMRGMISETCTPNVYVDGRHLRNLSADDIDDWVKPNEIAGIEIYVGPTAPPEFGGVGLSEEPCGSIVIWTRRSRGQLNQGSWKSRVGKALGLAALGVGVGAFFAAR